MPANLPKLNFPPAKFRVSRDARGMLIWDALRKMWLRLTPEEWVRQHLIEYLIDVCGAPAAAIRQEYPVSLGGMAQRADVVVFGMGAEMGTDAGTGAGARAATATMRPILLAECKAADVEVDEAVFAQAVRYNAVVGARYVVITNGLRHFVHELLPDGSYAPLQDFPNFPRQTEEK